MDQSRRVCEAVAGGELDVAIVGGDIPDELSETLDAVPYAEVRCSPSSVTRNCRVLCFRRKHDLAGRINTIWRWAILRTQQLRALKSCVLKYLSLVPSGKIGCAHWAG